MPLRYHSAVHHFLLELRQPGLDLGHLEDAHVILEEFADVVGLRGRQFAGSNGGDQSRGRLLVTPFEALTSTASLSFSRQLCPLPSLEAARASLAR